MLPIRTILHATDFSESSRPAFELACALARDYSAALVVTHVVPPTQVYAPDGIAIPFVAEDAADAHAKLVRLRPSDGKLEIEYRLLEGDPAEIILKLAKSTSADLIVMGTHGSTGLTRLLVGSVAEAVLRRAHCPVLTVREPSAIAPAPAPEAAAIG